MNKETAPIRKIASDLYMITLPMPFRLGHVNVYVLTNGAKAVLFDTGLNINESRGEFGAALDTLNLSPADIEHVFLTHFHADHCGAASHIRQASGATIHMSEQGARQIQKLDEMNAMIERTGSYLKAHGLPEKTIGFIEKFFILFRQVTSPFEVNAVIRPHDMFTVGTRTIEAIPTPGHANGHTCFYLKDDGILISGDHVLPDITPNLGPDLFDSSFFPLEAFLASLAGVRDLPVSMVCPAHGAPFPDLKGRVDEIIEHHRVRKQLVLDAVRKKERSTYLIACDVFENNLTEFDKFLALNETYVHLLELEKEEIISRKSRDNCIIHWSA